jgi:hypothetical protein
VDSSTTVAPWDCDYDEVCASDVFGVVCEGDVWVIIASGELPDLASVHIEADRRQVSGERECKRQSDIAQAGDADGFVF